jgi:hypothetical protein
MKRGVATGLIILFALVAAVGLAACGKKDRPALSDKEFPFRIEELSATLESGWAVLKGRLVKPSGKKTEISESEITGWRVYHAHYPVENGPCEGCPLDFSRVYEIDGKIGEDGQFSTRVVLEPPVKGIHFFEVRLTGRGWAAGALSDRAKLVIH